MNPDAAAGTVRAAERYPYRANRGLSAFRQGLRRALGIQRCLKPIPEDGLQHAKQRVSRDPVHH
jgi:hypothetical protein